MNERSQRCVTAFVDDAWWPAVSELGALLYCDLVALVFTATFAVLIVGSGALYLRSLRKKGSGYYE